MRLFFAIAAFCACVSLGLGQSDPGASLEKYRKELESNPSSSLAHYRIAEIFFQQKNYQSAANEFRAALNGDLQPDWIEVQSHLNLGTIFDLTGQSDRALNEYRLAQAVNRNSVTTSDNPLPPGAYRVSNGVVAPQPLLKTEPEYSEEARLAGLEGAVWLTGTITEQGIPRDMRVTRSLGFGLDEKALAELLISSRDSSSNVEIELTPDYACATSGGGVRLGHAAVAVADLPGGYDSHYGRVGF